MLQVWPSVHCWSVSLLARDNVKQRTVALALFYEPINNRVFPASSAAAATPYDSIPSGAHTLGVLPEILFKLTQLADMDDTY